MTLPCVMFGMQHADPGIEPGILWVKGYLFVTSRETVQLYNPSTKACVSRIERNYIIGAVLPFRDIYYTGSVQVLKSLKSA